MARPGGGARAPNATVLFKLGVIASLSKSHLRYDADALFAARQIACIAAPRHRWNSSPLVSRRSPLSDHSHLHFYTSRSS
jgi:hypothetical protein